MKCVIIFVALLAASGFCNQLPDDIKRCSPKVDGFDECMRVAVQGFYRKMKNAIPEVGFPVLDPLQIPLLEIPPGDRPAAVVQRYTNISVYGWSGVDVTQVHFDLAKKTYFSKGFYPEFKMTANYELGDEVDLIPIEGHGPCVITMTNVTVTSTAELEEYEKDGSKHFKVLKWTLTMDPEHVTYKFDNLLNGDKKIGDAINKIINENWQDIYRDAKIGYQQAFATVYLKFVNGLFDRVPITELFA